MNTLNRSKPPTLWGCLVFNTQLMRSETKRKEEMHLIDKILNNPKEMKRIEISSLNQKLGYWKNQEKKAKKYVKKYQEEIKQIERKKENG